MAELTPIAVDFTVTASTIEEFHVAAVQRLLALISNSPSVESVTFTFGALKPQDEVSGEGRILSTVWQADVAATIFYDEDKVVTTDAPIET